MEDVRCPSIESGSSAVMAQHHTEVDCKFTTRIEECDGRYVITIPDREVKYRTVSPGDVVQVSVQRARGHEEEGDPSENRSPPVAPGDRRKVEIEDIGEKGDGIARVERGYVVIVPDVELGEELEVEIEEVQENFGFARRIDRQASQPN